MATNNTHRRVVITGMGTVSPLGLDVQSTWEGMLAGRSGAASITEFDTSELPTRFAATIKDFDAEERLNRREARRLGRLTHLALAATDEAVQESGLDLSKEDPVRIGIEMGSAFGALGIVEDFAVQLQDTAIRAMNPTLAPAVLITSTPCYMAIRYGAQGVANSPVVACATGVISLGEAARRIARGEMDIMLAGGTDSYYTPLLLASFSRLGAMSTRNDDPETACRPFDAERDGMLMGEGAVAMVLESLEHAQARGATILAEYGGMGFTVDGYNMAAPDPEGFGASRSINLALQEAEVQPEQIDYVAAHGTGTHLNDISETKALKTSLGEHAYNIPVVSVKPMIGHAMGAAGAFNALTIVQAMRTGWVPATINYSVPDPECDLDYVPNQPRQVEVNYGLANAFGLGGQNGSLVIKRYQG